MTDKEIINLVASLAIESKKTDEQMKKQMKKGSEEAKALREAQRETSEQMKKTDEQMKKTDEQMKKTDKKLKSIGIQLGGISKNQGDSAEEFFINSISVSLKVAGIQYDELHKNMNKRTKKIQGEFDIVLVNGKDVAIIEVKYKAHNEDLDDLINNKLVRFKELFPEYKNYKHHLGLASFYINDNLKQDALSRDIFVLQRKGDIIESFIP